MKLLNAGLQRIPIASLPVRGAWVEMLVQATSSLLLEVSLPVRGAWVEIALVQSHEADAPRRSPCGERGLKSYKWLYAAYVVSSRSPCGERGLKWLSQ